MTLKMESGLLPNISYSILLFMTKVAFLNREEKNTPFFQQKKITLESRNAKNINFSSYVLMIILFLLYRYTKIIEAF